MKTAQAAIVWPVNFSTCSGQVGRVDFDRLFEEEFDGLYGYLVRRVGPFLARDLAAEVT